MSLFQSIQHTRDLGDDGAVESVQPLEPIQIETALGPLVPIHHVEDHGRKKLTPVKLHKNGRVKSMSLQDATLVRTPLGDIPAELVTFYESGAARRVFPLNGKLSGYWTEQNEYKLARTLSIPTPIGVLAVKPLYIQFYETGELKSILMWPKEKVIIDTPVGKMKIRKGVSFHRNGALASCEPDTPVPIETPLGTIEAHDPDPDGLTEHMSLQFTDTGGLAGLSTTRTVVNSVDGGRNYSFAPAVRRSMCSDNAFTVSPLKIAFRDDVYAFRNGRIPIGEVSALADFSLASFQTDKTLAGAKCEI